MSKNKATKTAESLYRSFINFFGRLSSTMQWMLHGFALVSLAMLLLSYHFSDDKTFFLFSRVISVSSMLYFVGFMAVRLIGIGFSPIRIRSMLIDLMIVAALIVTKFKGYQFFSLYLIGRQTYMIVKGLAYVSYNEKIFRKLSANPPVFFLLSFFVVIILGSFLLSLPWAVSSNHHSDTPYLDALFTATSATCVTGLIVQDTGSYFTSFGQIIILILIQIGGLGIMTISTAFAILLGEKLTQRSENVMKDVMGESNRLDMLTLIKDIFLVTMLFEMGGAAVYYFMFRRHPLVTGSAGYYAVFHSISAFCNAGFSLFSDSLVQFKSSLGVNLITMFLIIVGGIGFSVLVDLRRNVVQRYNPGRLTLHTKLVLLMTVCLILIGFVAFFISEYNHTMRDFSFLERLLASMFQSVTTRTAGFNTIDNAQLSNSSVFITNLLMFIGASPGSTGGGVKTTTFAIIILSVLAIIKGGEGVSIFKRRISDEMLKRVLALIATSIGFISIMIFLLLFFETTPPKSIVVSETRKTWETAIPAEMVPAESLSVAAISDSVIVREPQRLAQYEKVDTQYQWSEQKSFRKVVFEAFSAFGTVGLSMGITADLTIGGKIIIILLMYLGRVGPLTLIFALTQSKTKKTLAYTVEKISIG